MKTTARKSTLPKPRRASASFANTTKVSRHAPTPVATPATKLDRVIAALRTPKGASIMQLSILTGWQPHSVRGALAGAIKKARGLSVQSEKIDGVRMYRITNRP